VSDELMATEIRAVTNASEIFTIGHSNQPIEKFLDLLTQHSIHIVVDSRSRPCSKYVPHFDREPLSSYLESHGIRYIYMGDELGGRPPEAEYYDAEGRVLYYRVAESERFKTGISRLVSKSQGFRLAVLCSEEDPNHCHRRLLITKVLTNHGISVQHIRGSGLLQSESQLSADEFPPQLEMFEATEQDRTYAWKSTQSVLRRDQPEISSRR
jgi:uncharacterized protein (DUF488 family)